VLKKKGLSCRAQQRPQKKKRKNAAKKKQTTATFWNAGREKNLLAGNFGAVGGSKR